MAQYVGQPGGFNNNGKSYYSNIGKPCVVDLQFTVTPTNGLGVTSVKSNGYVANVFMHTSTTPAAGNGLTNPNPASGYAWIQLKNNFNQFIGLSSSVIAPNSGSDIKIDNSAMTAGQVYVITTLGDASLDKWQAIGLPIGVTPAVGASFIALSTGGTGNTLTSRVQVPSVSGISGIEVVGTTNAMSNSTVTQYGGEWVMIQFLGGVFTGSALTAHNHNLIVKGGQASAGTDAVSAKTVTLGKESATDVTILGANSATAGGVVAASAGTPAGTISYGVVAPTTGSIVCLQMLFDGSSVTVDGL